MDAEAESLYAFMQCVHTRFATEVHEVIRRDLPIREGNEHRVYLGQIRSERRVVKITHPGKFGRREHTPFQYLLRWKLLNQFAPSLDARLEDCVINEKGELSIITSMAYFAGQHPDPVTSDRFVKSLGFELLRDASSTLDYVHPGTGLILRDCHAGNWIVAGEALVPIDIIPEEPV